MTFFLKDVRLLEMVRPEYIMERTEEAHSLLSGISETSSMQGPDISRFWSKAWTLILDFPVSRHIEVVMRS